MSVLMLSGLLYGRWLREGLRVRVLVPRVSPLAATAHWHGLRGVLRRVLRRVGRPVLRPELGSRLPSLSRRLEVSLSAGWGLVHRRYGRPLVWFMRWCLI